MRLPALPRTPRWLAVGALLLATSAAVAGAGPSSAAVAPSSDYQLQNVLTSSVGPTSPLTNIAAGNTFPKTTVLGTANRTVLRYPTGSGLRRGSALTSVNAGVYSIAMVWKPDDVSGSYHRILDLSDGTQETGLYERAGRLSAYPDAESTGTPITAGAFSQIVLTRTAAGLVSVYVNGNRQVQFTNTGAAWQASSVMRFGKDNGSEETGGQFARIRLYKSALTATDVKALDVLPDGQSDVGVTYTDSPDPVARGGLLSYSATVKNNGPSSTARTVQLTLTVPAGTTFVGTSPSLGSCAAPAGGSVTCALGDLTVGRSAQVLLVVKAPPGTGSISSKATVSSPSADNTTNNNTATQGTTVR